MAKRQTRQNQKGTTIGKRAPPLAAAERIELENLRRENALLKSSLSQKQRTALQIKLVNRELSLQHKAEMKRDAEALKRFRKQVRELQKQGLVSTKYNAKEVRPTDALRKLISKNASVLTGESKAKKVTRKQAAVLKGKGYRVVNDRAILPDGATVDANGKVTRHATRKRKIHFIDEAQFSAAYKRNGWDKRKPFDAITVYYNDKRLDNMGHPYDLKEVLEFINRYSSRKDLSGHISFGLIDLSKKKTDSDDA